MFDTDWDQSHHTITGLHVQVQVQVHTPSSGKKKKKVQFQPSNQKHLCTKWGLLTGAHCSGTITPLQLSGGFNKTHESTRDVHSSSNPSHPIKVQPQQETGLELILPPYSLASPQVNHNALASPPDVPRLAFYSAVQKDKQRPVTAARRQTANTPHTLIAWLGDKTKGSKQRRFLYIGSCT